MKFIPMLFVATLLIACSDKSDVTDAERKAAHDKLYKTPPPSDRSKDKGF